MPAIEFYLEKIPEKAPPELRRIMTEDAKKRVLVDVFGEGFKRGPGGKPVEQGLGSKGNQTAESVSAYELRGRNEAGYVENLARMRRELADCQARKAAAAADVQSDQT